MSSRYVSRAVGRRPRRFDGKIAVAGMLALLVLIAQTGLGHSALRAAGISGSDESFVELYFPDPRTLPSTVPASGQLGIRFAMGNVGSEARPFVWKISEDTGKAQLRLASGRSVVAGNGKAVVAELVRVHCPGTRAHVVISLERSTAKITMWLACPRRR
jgi:hypothetical protein